jgi:hypothetical protein
MKPGQKFPQNKYSIFLMHLAMENSTIIANLMITHKDVQKALFLKTS